MTEGRFFIQISGVPGAGKSTIASAVARQTGAVVIDHDVTKSALLVAAVPADLAGRASYRGFAATLAAVTKAQGRIILSLTNPYSAVLRQKVESYFDSGTATPYLGVTGRSFSIIAPCKRTSPPSATPVVTYRA